MVAVRSDGFEKGFYLSYMVILSERIKIKGFLGPSEFRGPFYSGMTPQVATLTVRSNDYALAQT